MIRRLAQALRVSADALVFDVSERGPDEELAFQFEAVSRLPNEEREAIRTMLEAMIVKSQGATKAGSADRPATSKAAAKTTAKRAAPLRSSAKTTKGRVCGPSFVCAQQGWQLIDWEDLRPGIPTPFSHTGCAALPTAKPNTAATITKKPTRSFVRGVVAL